MERYVHGELSNQDSIHFDESLRYKTKVSGRTVYGGGGIMPDLFIAVDTTMFSDYYRDLVASGSVNRTIINYEDKNRAALKAKYPDYKTFASQFKATDELIDLLIKEGEAADIEYNKEQMEVSYGLMEKQLKALIARDLFTTSEYFQSINEISEAYNKALEIIEAKRDYTQLLKE